MRLDTQIMLLRKAKLTEVAEYQTSVILETVLLGKQADPAQLSNVENIERNGIKSSFHRILEI